MTVLIIDDQKPVRILLRKILENNKLNVLEAENKKSAFEVLSENSVDLAILDVHLGQDDGYQLCRDLKEHDDYHDIPVIFLTGSDNANALDEAYKAGGVDFVQKPINAGSLMMRLKSHLAHALSKRKIKEQHEKLKAYQSVIIQNEKHGAITRMVGGIAHEMNNPLACIKSNFSLLKKYLCRMNYDQSDHFNKDLNTCVEVLEETSEEFEQLKKITDKLLILDLPEDEIQSFSILEAINAAITFVKNQNLKCEIEISIEEGLPGILCNPTSLTDALFNLIDNAMAATKDSSFPKVTIKAINSDNFIAIKISDNGAGIPDKNLLKIFDPFFTTKEIGRGTGIGLTNVQQTINQLHGSIDVQSKLGEGTTFTINLPLN